MVEVGAAVAAVAPTESAVPVIAKAIALANLVFFMKISFLQIVILKEIKLFTWHGKSTVFLGFSGIDRVT